MTRETRLLVVTISVSAIVLVLLSQLRFPDRPPLVTASPAPLERLAARATYDELAAIVAGLEAKIAPSLVVLRMAPQTDTRSRQLSDVMGPAPVELAVRHVPALRLDETTAVAALDSPARLLGIVGPDGTTPPAEIVAADALRRVALVKVPTARSERPRDVALTDLQTPTYVVVVEGTRAGLTFRPLFIGSSDRFADPRWPRPLLAVSTAALAAPGALVFTLQGQFLGWAVIEAGTLAIAGAHDIVQTASDLARGSAGPPVELGLRVQPLSSALAAALGARHGAVIVAVDPDGPAAGILEPGDVITAINDIPVESADDFLVRLAQSRRSSTVALWAVRQGTPLALTITIPASTEGTQAGGMALDARRGVGSAIVSVAPGRAADRAGLRPGDIIVRAQDTAAPLPPQIEALRQQAGSSGSVLLTIEREGRAHFVALAGVAPRDGSR